MYGVVIFIGLLLILAVCQDFKTYQVSNKIFLTGIMGSLVYQLISCSVVGIASWITGMGVLFIIGLPVWALGMFGAGDVKLIMMIGSCFGVAFAIKVSFYALCIGAVFSIGKMLYVGNLTRRLQFLCNYISCIFIHKRIISYGTSGALEKDKIIHFSFPIALGYLWLYLDMNLF